MHPRDYTELKLAGGGEPFDALLTPAQRAFAAIGVGNTKGYALIAEGKLVARKVGAKTMVETASLRAYVASLPTLPTKAA